MTYTSIHLLLIYNALLNENLCFLKIQKNLLLSQFPSKNTTLGVVKFCFIKYSLHCIQNR